MIISEKELADARVAWGEGIILISKSYNEKGIDEATTVANEFLDNLYGFELGPVLFKPTLSGGNQTFRTNKEGALSYFLGNNPRYPKDNGFGIKSWCKFESQTTGIFLEKKVAIWMGWVTLTNNAGDLIKVDKSWGYKKSSNGILKIVSHHSSLPYEG